MSDLVLQWLNRDVGLSKKVKVFERDFANGFLFAELLNKHGYLADFDGGFVNQGTLSAKSANFAKLGAAFRGPAVGLGVKWSEELAREIMQEDRGSSLRVLYQLRKGLLQRNDAPGRKVVANVPRQAKVMRGEHDERFFDEKLKTLRPIDPRVAHEVGAKHFVDEHTRQMGAALEHEAQVADEVRYKVQSHREGRLHAMIAKQDDARRQMTDGHVTWHGVQTRKAATLAKDLNFEKQMIRREQDKTKQVRAEHRQETGYGKDDDSVGINWFERNLARIGIDTSEHSGSTGNEIPAESLKELYDKMHEKLPTAAQLQVEVSKRMKKIKDTKRSTDMARKERERRQHRMHVEQQATQIVVEDQKREEDELTWLLKVTVGYRKEAAACDREQRLKEAARVEREARQTAKAEVVAQEHEEAYQRTKAKAREEFEATQAERTRLKATMGQQELADCSSDDGEDEFLGGFGRASGSTAGGQFTPQSIDSPGSVRRGGSKSAPPLELELPASPTPPAIPPAEQLLACVQEARVTEYLYARGEWARHQPSEAEVAELSAAAQGLHEPAADVAGQQPRLGSLVRHLCAPPEPAPLDSANLPLQLMPIVALAGSPVGLGGGAGASGVLAAVQRRLSEEFGMAVLEPQRVLAECMAMARGQEPEWPIAARLHALGKQLLERGEEAAAPAALVAEALFRKMELLWAPPPPPPEDEADKKKKKPPAKGKKGEEEGPPPQPKGVLLAGFPADFAQQAAFEGLLRGYLSPLLRLQNGEEDQQLQLSSVVAPWWSDRPGGALSGVRPAAKTAADDDDGAAAQDEDADPMDSGEEILTATSSPAGPFQILRIAHPRHADLVQAVVEEAADETAWGPPPRASVDGEEVPPGCQGFHNELATLASPVDRAWLFEEAQLLAVAHAAPLGVLHELAAVATPADEEGQAEETLEDACYRQARGLVAGWRRHTDDAVARAVEAREEAARREAAAAAAAEAAAEAEAAPAVETEAGGGEVAEISLEAADVQPGSEEQGAAEAVAEELVLVSPWPLVGPVVQARLRETWLQGLSSYYLAVQEHLHQAHLGIGAYSESVVNLQRKFLDFLQRGDEKPHIVDEYFKGLVARQQQPRWRPSEDDVAEEMEELSDRLWQLSDRRRADAVDERQRLMSGGFWEMHAAAATALAEEVQAAEHGRFSVGASVLFEAHGHAAPPLERPEVATPVGTGGPEMQPSTMKELHAALQASAWCFACEDILEAARETTIASRDEPFDQELVAALAAEHRGHVQRLHAAASWAEARLREMRRQLDEAFRRMDDWIRDRVRTENDAIKASISYMTAAVLSSSSSMEETSLSSPPASVRTRVGSRPSKGSSTRLASVRMQRREMLKILEPRTLDADVLQPPLPLEASLQSQLPPCAGAARASPRTSKEETADAGPWLQEMLCLLVARLLERFPSGAAALEGDDLLDVLLQSRCKTLSLQEDSVPRSWTQRSEEAWALLCKSFVSPAWGTVAVDVTEFLLDLAFHGRGLPEPSVEAMQASRELMLSEEGGLNEETRARYPDVPVSEDLFLRLPMWESWAAAEESQLRHEQFLRWLFRILRCFENEAQPQLLTVPGRARADGTAGAVSARRLFTYFGRAELPSEGLRRSLRLLLPPPPSRPASAASEEAPAGGGDAFASEGAVPAGGGMRVQDLRALLFSCHSGRPSGAVAAAPELEALCKQLLPQLYDKEAFFAAQEAAAAADPKAAKAKAKAKSKGKGKEEAPPEDEDVPPPPFEEAVLPLGQAEVLRHPVVLRGLLTHGGALCRHRALGTLFPVAGAATGPMPVSSAAGLAAVRPELLDSLVPPGAMLPRSESRQGSPLPP